MTDKKNNQEKEQWLENQIAIRISIAQEKLVGKHNAIAVPTSLRTNRVWEDEGLGVEKIGSPTSFTSTHETHGKSIKRLNTLLIKLKEPTKRNYKPLRETVENLKNENIELNDRLTKTANQFIAWQSELDEMRDMLQITQSSEQGLIESKREQTEELKEKEEIIKNLRKELVDLRNSGRKSNITEVDFGGDKQ